MSFVRSFVISAIVGLFIWLTLWYSPSEKIGAWRAARKNS